MAKTLSQIEKKLEALEQKANLTDGPTIFFNIGNYSNKKVNVVMVNGSPEAYERNKKKIEAKGNVICESWVRLFTDDIGES